MTKKQFWILVIVTVLLIVAVAVLIVMLRAPSAPTDTNSGGVTFPTASSTTNTTASSSTMTIQGQNGTIFATKNFIDNGTTIKDVENPGTYLVAGQLGYCLPDTPCTAGNNDEFNILYDSKANAFTIALLEEPLGKVRHDAETYLENALGISSTDLCSLNYYIGTTYTVNENYAGGNLGFSACPGAVKLP